MVDGVLLKLKEKIKRKKPSFKRQETGKHAKLKDVWRRPRGKHSKMRMHEKGRGAMPNPGYGSPGAVKGLNRLGLEETLVNNVSELSSLDPKAQAAVISSGVGEKKKKEILSKANELKIRVMNA
ncbi:MAG: 50S ribosomal protein L32e [Candidatus Micrarchaeota archaeon]|nr:50S ribosomal protein L32e [Candidatus Micrarchaeota archaeon]